MRRRFEMEEGGSAKFWEVSVDGSDLTVVFGKLGTGGQTKTKSFGSEADARAEADKLVREKAKKGYAERSDAATTKPAADRATVVADELGALRSDSAESLRDALGELRVLAADEEPEILGGFRLQPDDGDTWTSVLESVEWLFEEADG
ncbi:MAG: WGR domain-containing protein, partial [Deltaproteobacteria bacterium]